VTPATIDKAVRAVADMTRLDACAAAGVIASGPSLPVEPELRARVSELQAELDHVHGLELAGRGEEGSARADRAVASAEALGYGPVLTEALWRRAQLRSTFASDFAGAEADERAALERAAGEQNYALMAEVAVELLGNVGAQQRRFEEARGLQVAAELALRLADSPPLSKARLVTKLGAIKHSQEDFEAAAELFATAARLTAKAAGEDSLDHGFALNNVAVAHLQRGQAQQALPLFEQATRILRSALGPHHPSLAMVLGNAGMIHEQRGHLAEALAAYTAAQEAIAFVGDDHPHVATMLLNRAGVLATMRRGDEGRVLAARGLAAFERLFGPDSQRLARPLLMSASVASLAGDNALAEAHARRALEVIGDDVGQRATAASAHLVVAAAARAQGRAAEALTQAELAAAAIMAQPGADAASLAPALRERGAALLALGRVRASVAVLEDAVRRCEQGPTSAPPQVLVPMRSLFARALWRAGQRERARAVVAKVREDYGRMDCCQTEVAELDAWLAEHTER
jgi:tetratricopeptide (TPR) repeat protein